MPHFTTEGTTLFFNTRDELTKIKLSKVAYFEADENYCQVMFVNGVKVSLLTSLVNIEGLLEKCLADSKPMFARIGKRHIVNLGMIVNINLIKQQLMLSDLTSEGAITLSVSKKALKELKSLFTNK